MSGKVRRGPKEIPLKDKKVVIRTWVKKKHFAEASKECAKIEEKYEKKE